MRRKITLFLIPGRGSGIRAIEFPDVILHLTVVAGIFLLGSGVLAMRSEMNFLEEKKRLAALSEENAVLRAEVERLRAETGTPAANARSLRVPSSRFDSEMASRNKDVDPDPLAPLLQKVADTESGYGAALASMTFQRSRWECMPTILPVSGGTITSGFGKRYDPMTGEFAMHEGVDISAPSGTTVRATASGKVTFAGFRRGYGRMLVIDHGNGLLTRYAHLGSFSVRQGERVGRGDPVGTVGRSGYATGPHVHYEVRTAERLRNPEEFILPAGVIVD